MNELGLIGVYSSLNEKQDFCLLHVLHKTGPIDWEVMRGIYNEHFLGKDAGSEVTVSDMQDQHFIGPFIDVAQLEKFGFHLCQQMNCQDMHLFSIAEYNSIFERSQDLTTFKEGLSKGGLVVINNDKSGKKGYFAKLFQ